MTFHSRCRRYVDGRAQHSRRMLVQLCQHAENPVSSSLPACRDTTCTEPRIEACITCQCTNFGPQNMGRKSNVGAHNNWGVPIKVPMSVSTAPWSEIQKSVFYPPIELHGHSASAWRVIKFVPLVTDFMGKVYITKADRGVFQNIQYIVHNPAPRSPVRHFSWLDILCSFPDTEVGEVSHACEVAWWIRERLR
jgi:hypothetical protein